MLLQRITRSEPILAIITPVRPLARVTKHVLPERVALRESLLAERAPVRLRLGMCPLVNPHQVLPIKAPPTRPAGEGFRSRVHQDVILETSLRGEGLPASSAHVRRAVYLPVEVQPPPGVVDLSALVAGVGPPDVVRLVGLEVLLEVGAVHEGLVAVGADVADALVVDREVVGVVFGGVETLVAERTVGLVDFEVSGYVVPQQTLLAEVFEADRTAKALAARCW